MKTHNVIAFKGVVKAGLQAWFFDKKSLRNRLILMPLLLPFFFVAMFLAIALAIYFRDTGTITAEQDGLPTRATVMAVVQTEHYQTLRNTVIAAHPSYSIVEIDKKDIKKNLTDRKVTFALELEQVGDDFEFVVYMDNNRNYVHKQWLKHIDKLKDRIMINIVMDSMEDHQLPPQLKSALSGDASMRTESFGSNGGVSVLLGIMILLWNILIVAPVDYAKTTLYRLFVEDVSCDLLPTWKSAKLSPSVLLLGRISSALIVYMVSSLVMLLHVLVWVWGYSLLVDWILAQDTIISNPQIQNITVGFQDFIAGQSIASLLTVFMTMSITAFMILLYFVPGTLRSMDSEQARNKNKLFDFMLINIPLIGFIVGFSGMNLYSTVLPVFNAYHLSSGALSGALSLGYYGLFVLSTMLFALPFWLKGKRIMKSDERYLMQK